MRRCTSQTGNSPLWYSTSRTPNSVVPRPKRAMLAREWRSTASNARASTTHSMSPVSPGTVVLDAIIRRYLLGLLTPLASLLVLGTMAVAIAKVHGPKGFFVQNGGYEYNLVLIIAALTLALAGPGAFSLDHLLGFAR